MRATIARRAPVRAERPDDRDKGDSVDPDVSPAQRPRRVGDERHEDDQRSGGPDPIRQRMVPEQIDDAAGDHRREGDGGNQTSSHRRTAAAARASSRRVTSSSACSRSNTSGGLIFNALSALPERPTSTPHFAEVIHDRTGKRAVRVARLTVTDELDADQQPERTDVADQDVSGMSSSRAPRIHAPLLGRVALLLLDHVEHRERGLACHRVAAERAEPLVARARTPPRCPCARSRRPPGGRCPSACPA